ncbi:hypothetical protein ACRQ5Q_22430 [Bradyrhizobium sp. PMVTL-01]|uniref:hypothetical protein n=1 Tax=Bradyrhizobium sp. PMVTL-01 TaxID=3434999 RepID=UPI003F70909E
MSIVSMNWALSQELESCPQQALLYVIADSADPNGMTRHCDADYMARKARLSRATMFRRLSELEELGLLVRRKYYTEQGAQRYEIQLNLEARVILPIRTRKGGDDDAGGDHEAENAEIPKSHGETLVQPQSHSSETAAVSPVRPGQSHSCDCISPPLSEGLPPNPPPGGVRSRREVEAEERREGLWRQFLGSYMRIARMDQAAAREEFDKLSIDDAEWAVSSAPPYAAECAKDRVAPKNANTWLRKGMFKNFRRGGPPPARPDSFALDSPEGRAIAALHQVARKQPPERNGRVTYRGEITPQILAMAKAGSRSTWRWRDMADCREQIGSWAGFIEATVPGPRGAFIESRGLGKDQRSGIYAPWPFPPSKDGTIYQDQPEGEADGSSGAA